MINHSKTINGFKNLSRFLSYFKDCLAISNLNLTFSLQSYGDVSYHEASSKYVITVYSNITDYKLHYSQASYEYEIVWHDQLYLTDDYNITVYFPYGFAFSESYQILLTRNESASIYDIWIGPTGPTYVYSTTTTRPNEIAVRDFNRTHAKVFYSRNKTDGNGYELITDIANTTYDIHTTATYDLGPDNCGNHIQSNGTILVIACNTTDGHGMLSVYRESDMTLYTEIRGNSSFTGILNDVAIISTDYHHQIFFNSFNTTSKRYGQISRVEILVDRQDPNKNKTFLEVQFYEDNIDYFQYAKYFDKDPENRLFISNLKDDRDQGNSIDLIQICTYEEYFNASSNTCHRVNPGEITFGVQQTIPNNCSTYNDTDYKNRTIAESVCDFGCSLYQFGKNCESCSAYMARVGAEAPAYYKFDDSNPIYCGLIEDTQYCSRITDCVSCEFEEGCSYSSGSCVNTTEIIPDFSDVIDVCDLDSETTFSNDEDLCGNSTIDICSGSTFSLGSEGLIPANTVCQWDLVCSSTFSIDLRLQISSVVEIEVRASINGNIVAILPTARRSLDSRRALTTTEIFSIVGADSAEIFYRNSEDFNSTIITTTVCANGDMTSSNSGCNWPPVVVVEPSPTESKSDSSDSSAVLIAILVPSLLIGLCGSCCIFMYCRRRYKASRGRQNNYQDNTGPQLQVNIGIPVTLGKVEPYEIIENGAAPVEKAQNQDLEATIVEDCIEVEPKKSYKDLEGTCSICREAYKSSPPLAKVIDCKHIFHKSCVDELIKNTLDNKLNCPECRHEKISLE